MSKPKKTLVEGLKVEEGRTDSKLIAPIKDLIAYHEKYAKDHVGSQWIYGENMMVVQAHKKLLAMIDLTMVSGPDGRTFKCKARSSNMAANDPQECDWPVCGCDEYADKVIAALQECGWGKLAAEHLKREQEPAPRVTPEMMSNVFAQSVQRKDSEHNHIYDHRIAAELLNKLLEAQPPQELVSLRESGMHAELEKWGTLDFHYVGCKCAICQREPWRQQVIGDLSAGEQTNQIERLNILARAALTRGAVGG